MKIKKLINWLPKVGYYINSSSIKQDGAPQSDSAAPVVIKIEAYATPAEPDDNQSSAITNLKNFPIYGTISSSYISKIKEVYENSNIAEQGENIPNVLLVVYESIDEYGFNCLTSTPNVIMSNDFEGSFKVFQIMFPVMLSGELLYIDIGCSANNYDKWYVAVYDDINSEPIGEITIVEDE